MTSKKTDAKRYVDGDAPLPATFTTGFKRDLEVAREMVKLRQQDTETRATGSPDDRIGG